MEGKAECFISLSILFAGCSHLKSLFHVKQAFFKQNYFSFQLFRAIIETFMRINDMERKQIAISFCFGMNCTRTKQREWQFFEKRGRTMGKIIAIANQKGGVGKDHHSGQPFVGARREGKKTLLVDIDPQGNSSSGSAWTAGSWKILCMRY